MSSSLRARIALVSIFGVLLIPLGTSSLRGLTHLLTCDETTDTHFSVLVGPQGDASVLSSVQLDREDSAREVCGGLVVDLGVRSRDGGSELLVTITNGTDFGWMGSVRVDLDKVSIPIAVGEIDPRTSATEVVPLELEADRVYELSGTLLIGP